MGTLGYYLSLPLIYGISVLPFPVLYLLSDLFEFLLFGVLGYRLKVVRANLRNSFPEKSTKELKQLERLFRRWFCDLMLETIKTLTVTPAQLERRISVEGTELLKNYFNAGTSVIIVMGHWGNWELGGARFSQLPYHKLNVIYHPLANAHFDRLFIRMRTRLGNGLYPMKETVKCMVRDRAQVTATAFIADQTPAPEHAYWTTFLNQATPVFWGTEKIARKLGLPVIYLGIDRPRRGRYAMRFELLVADPKGTTDGAISELHTRRLEVDVRKRPEIWLWTHRRWKHRAPVPDPSGTA
ncbi:MAG: lysophospholipid acyltransferase family protein [Flavobacteriales bacterium]|jgi:KDO2-lipid IV(A) lauroyltransferase|nr:lysophospholipid acyltransferase family protein [Flavobacteriales bacterium]MCB0759567.1 lysophospholipid acyltransferase family protein [Flavobacteriales bacterium]